MDFFLHIYNLKMPIILAIDCGTTSTRVIAFKDPNTILSVAQKPLPISHPNLGWAEQDPSLMWQLTRTCLDQVISRVGASNVHAIGITNQRETAIAWQKSSGKPIAPAISWQCRRTKSRCNDLLPYASMIKEKTGLPVDPYFSATKFEWLLQTHDRSQSLLENNDLCFGTVDAWLLFNLTNGAFFLLTLPMRLEQCFLILMHVVMTLSFANYLIFPSLPCQMFPHRFTSLVIIK